ncbi:hypothetical protein B0F90DRAFT_1685991 [Multifurca ochricompacta]|uniref:Secreted protein n=1 Tax=Multifurca ochricompacta TaxID=376703 RepID=A0AAD4QPS1_9AGAM|nr:hypothetical protein B0F90DRAFT_1685991 [Multifurca ochricompacta]
MRLTRCISTVQVLCILYRLVRSVIFCQSPLAYNSNAFYLYPTVGDHSTKLHLSMHPGRVFEGTCLPPSTRF